VKIVHNVMLVLAFVFYSVTAFADQATGSLAGVVKMMGPVPLSEVRKQAAKDAKRTPKYRSTGTETRTFVGDYTTDSDPVALAIHSDDGSKVTIWEVGADGNPINPPVLEYGSAGALQHLPNLSQSFHFLNFILEPHKTYRIQVDYQNTIYVKTVFLLFPFFDLRRDIDGCTLFTYSWKPDLLVDTNRDGKVDRQDEAGKETWVKDLGAIFMANQDDDDARGRSDTIEFNDRGNPDPATEDNTIQGNGDVNDVARLVVRAVGTKDGYQFFLRMDADDLKAVHIFGQRAAGQTKIFGGWTDFHGAAGDQALDITARVNENSDVEFGIEALFLRGQRDDPGGGGAVYEFDGEVDVELVVQKTVGAAAIVPASIVSTDRVRLRVAPYLMLPNTLDATEVWMSDRAETNAIATAFGGLAKRAPNPSQWFQDHIQIGMTTMPGASMHLTMRLPYDRPPQPDWPVTPVGGVRPLLQRDRGVYRLRNTLLYDGADSGDYGGNLEIIPPSDQWPLGRIIVGSPMSARTRDFFAAQVLAGPNAIQEPFVVNTDWLAVGHVDEILCPLPGGTRGFKVAMASPHYARDLLQNGDAARGVTAAPSGDKAVFAEGAEASGIASNAITTTDAVWLFDGAAHGHIHCIVAANIADGETVVISDGAANVTFEFDKNGAVGAGHISVNIAAAASAQDVRDVLLTAVNGVGAGLKVTAYEDGTDDLVLINDALGTAGNVPLVETVANAGFTVQGMVGGETAANSRDFTTTTWRWVRIYDGTGAGQVAFIDTASGAIRGKGFLCIRNTGGDPVCNTTSLVAWDAAAGVDGVYRYVSRSAAVPTTSGWSPEPDNTSRYIVAENCRLWFDGVGPFPALISVHEILGDATLRLLNEAAEARVAAVRTDIQTAMGAAQAGGNFLRHDSNLGDDALDGDTDDDFVGIPVLFFGRWTAGLTPRENVAYTPGLANVQSATAPRPFIAPGLFVFAQQFGPRVAGADVFQTVTSSIIGSSARYADDWDLYHRLDGEVHCGTEVVRRFFQFNWWTKQP
jgi:hypothetical protein